MLRLCVAFNLYLVRCVWCRVLSFVVGCLELVCFLFGVFVDGSFWFCVLGFLLGIDVVWWLVGVCVFGLVVWCRGVCDRWVVARLVVGACGGCVLSCELFDVLVLFWWLGLFFFAWFVWYFGLVVLFGCGLGWRC